MIPGGGRVTSDAATTMAGFQWSPTPGYVPAETGEDGWCMRDAVCQLFDWPPGSENWSQFVENPQGADTLRLADHLGLTCLQVPQDWNELIARLDHPGVAIFDFHIYQKSHAIYVNDLRWLLHHWPTVDGKPAVPGDRPLRSFGWPLGV
jgi:hypothetical protein